MSWSVTRCWDAFVEGKTSENVVRERRPTFYPYVPDGNDASDYVLIQLNRKGNRREFQVGSFGGISGGKSGVKRDKEIPVRAEHVGIRTYRVTPNAGLKPGEYAIFMGTGHQHYVVPALWWRGIWAYLRLQYSRINQNVALTRLRLVLWAS